LKIETKEQLLDLIQELSNKDTSAWENITTKNFEILSEFCTYYNQFPFDEIEQPVNSSDFSEVVKDAWYNNFLNNNGILNLTIENVDTVSPPYSE